MISRLLPAERIERYVAWLELRKKIILAVSGLFFIIGGIGVSLVVFDLDVLVYFDRSMPERQMLEANEARFGRTNEVVYVLRARSGGSMLKTGRLQAIGWLQEQAAKAPHAITTRSPITLVEKSRRISPYASPDQIRRAAKHAGFSARPVLSKDETVAAIAVIYPRAIEDDIDIERVTTAARKLRDEFQSRFPDIEALMTGRLMIDRAFVIDSQTEIYGYVALQILILALVLILAFRSFYAAGALMALVIIVGPIAIGAVGFLGIPLNGISGAATTVLLGLGVATGVHIILTWKEALGRGHGKQGAIAIAIQTNIAPVLLSILTTIISFLCLNLAASPPFGQLGNIVSFGLVIVLILSFTLLPTLLLCIPYRNKMARWSLAKLIGRLGRLIIRRSWIVLCLFSIAAAVAAGGITQIRFDDQFSHYFDERFEIRRATDLFEKKLSGTTFIDFSVPVAGHEHVFAPEHLARQKRFLNWLQRRPEFADATAMQIIAERYRNRLPAPGRNQHLRTRLEAKRALRELYKHMRRDGLIQLTDPTERHSRINVVLKSVSSAEILRFVKQAKTKAEAIFGAPVTATGLPVLSARLSINSTRTMLFSIIAALAGVSALMLLALRDLRLGIISLIPNVLPAAAAIGIWGYWIGEVSFAATVVGALTFGILVDDTVHMLMKYQASRARGRQPLRASLETIRTVGSAVFVTSIALALSFAVFMHSGFLVNQHLGLLTALTLVIALLADLLILPPLVLLSEILLAPAEAEEEEEDADIEDEAADGAESEPSI